MISLDDDKNDDNVAFSINLQSSCSPYPINTSFYKHITLFTPAFGVAVNTLDEMLAGVKTEH